MIPSPWCRPQGVLIPLLVALLLVSSAPVGVPRTVGAVGDCAIQEQCRTMGNGQFPAGCPESAPSKDHYPAVVHSINADGSRQMVMNHTARSIQTL